MLWTAVGIWLEPLRSNFDYGQINVLLVLAVLYAVYSTRWWLSGLLVGLAAGVKLTPAVGGLVLPRRAPMGDRGVLGGGVLRRRSACLGVGGRRPNPLLLHRTARRRQPGGPDRNVVQPVVARRHLADSRPRRGLRAARGGGDRRHRRAGGAGVARARRRRSDRLGAIVVVQLFGLLLSPISWTHHWVWLLPLMIWLLHGPLRERLGARMLGWGWLALTARRGAVAAELRAADDLGDQPAVVSGLGRADLHRRDAGDAGVDRVYGFPTISFISRAIPRSFSVMPPSEWVTNTKVTVRQRISMSGWWSFCSACLGHPAHRVDAVEEGGKLDRAAQGAVGALPAVRSGSAASTCSSVNTAMLPTYRCGFGRRPSLPNGHLTEILQAVWRTCEIPSGSAWNTTGQRRHNPPQRRTPTCGPRLVNCSTAGADPTVVHGQRCLVCRICHRPCGVGHLGVRDFETPTCPTKSVSADDLRTNDQPNRGLRADTAAGRHACASAAPCRYPRVRGDSLSPVPAETLTPAPSPQPRLPRLHDLFPRLFPGG